MQAASITKMLENIDEDLAARMKPGSHCSKPVSKPTARSNLTR